MNKKTEFHRCSTLSSTSAVGSRSRLPQVAETKLLSLILRRIWHNKISTAMSNIKSHQKSRHHHLKILNRIAFRVQKCALMQISMHGNQRVLHEKRYRGDRVQCGIFITGCLQRLYCRNLKIAFGQICINNKVVDVRKLQIVHLTTWLQQLINRTKLRKCLRAMYRKCAKVQQNKASAQLVFFRLEANMMRNLKSSIHSMWVISTQNCNEQMLSVVQKRRKEAYEFQANRRQFIAQERYSIYNTKQQIDSLSVERNVKVAEIKRSCIIKLNQQQLRLQNTKIDLGNCKAKVAILQRKKNNMNSVVNKRSRLSTISAGSQSKMLSLYKVLISTKQIKSSSSSSLIIQLNRNKFCEQLAEFENICGYIDDFEIYKNIVYRNLVCLYEAVPVETFALSQEYREALEENLCLKDFINSLIKYSFFVHLNQNIQNTAQEVEQSFINYWDYLETKKEVERPEKKSMIMGSMQSLNQRKDMRCSLISLH